MIKLTNRVDTFIKSAKRMQFITKISPFAGGQDLHALCILFYVTLTRVNIIK